MKRQAIPYIRFSSFKQSEGDSYSRQKKACDSWLNAHPEYIRSTLVFEDLGRSGYATGDKKKYKQASGLIKIQEAINAGLIRSGDLILLEALDRATRRNMVDAWDLITPILKADVSICTLDDGIIYTKESLNGSHIFLLVAKIQAAHGYSKILSERVSASYTKRRNDAIEGKPVKRNTPIWLTTEGELIPDIADKVRECFNLYIAGMGKHSIASRMRKYGGKLALCSGTVVSAWLTNSIAAGVWANTDSKNKEEPIRGVYPPIIEEEQFYLVQKLIKERSNVRTITAKNFISGLVKCSHCGSTMITHNVNGKPNSFRCLSHHRLKDAGCSNNKSIPVNVIYFRYLSTAIYAVGRSLSKQTLSNEEKRKLKIEQEIDTLSRTINKLVKMAMVVDDIEEIQEQLKVLQEKRQQLKTEVEGINAGAVVFNEIKLALNEEQRLLQNDPIVLNAMLKDAGYSITCSDDGSVVCSEQKEWVHKYLGVKRKTKSNSTDWLRLSGIHIPSGKEIIYKLHPNPPQDISATMLDTLQNAKQPIPGRVNCIWFGEEL